MLSVKFNADGRKEVRVHKPILKKLEEVAVLLDQAGSILHPQAAMATKVLREILDADSQVSIAAEDAGSPENGCCGKPEACEQGVCPEGNCHSAAI